MLKPEQAIEAVLSKKTAELISRNPQILVNVWNAMNQYILHVVYCNPLDLLYHVLYKHSSHFFVAYILVQNKLEMINWCGLVIDPMCKVKFHQIQSPWYEILDLPLYRGSRKCEFRTWGGG